MHLVLSHTLCNSPFSLPWLAGAMLLLLVWFSYSSCCCTFVALLLSLVGVVLPSLPSLVALGLLTSCAPGVCVFSFLSSCYRYCCRCCMGSNSRSGEVPHLHLLFPIFPLDQLLLFNIWILPFVSLQGDMYRAFVPLQGDMCRAFSCSKAIV